MKLRMWRCIFLGLQALAAVFFTFVGWCMWKKGIWLGTAWCACVAGLQVWAMSANRKVHR